MSCVSATLAVWTSAWLNGHAAADDVLDALQVWAEHHEVLADDDGTATALDLPTDQEAPVSPALLLAALRKAEAGGAYLVLPIPGDVRGLGGKSPLSASALRAGQAVVLPEPGIGLVPEPVVDGLQRWTVFDLPSTTPRENVPLSAAEHELTSAMRQAATALMDTGAAKRRQGVRQEIDAIIAGKPELAWPEGMPSRSLRILQRANEVSAILDVASADILAGAVSASAARARVQALQPLVDAVRNARCAAIDEAVRVFSEQANHH